VIFGLSEYFLKEYSIKYNWKYLCKNILIFAGIGGILWWFVVDLLNHLSRIETFLSLALISIIYFGIYALVNKKDFEYFI